MTTTTTLTTLASLDDVVAFVAAADAPLFVRRSNGPDADRRMGCSTDHSTGTVHCGVSVNPLTRPAWWTDSDRAWVAMTIRDYRTAPGMTYILTGDEIGRDTDNAPLLDPGTWSERAIISEVALDEAMTTPMRDGCQHPADRQSRYTSGAIYCDACGIRLDTR